VQPAGPGSPGPGLSRASEPQAHCTCCLLVCEGRRLRRLHRAMSAVGLARRSGGRCGASTDRARPARLAWHGPRPRRIGWRAPRWGGETMRSMVVGKAAGWRSGGGSGRAEAGGGPAPGGPGRQTGAGSGPRSDGRPKWAQPAQYECATGAIRMRNRRQIGGRNRRIGDGPRPGAGGDVRCGLPSR
jgi:hypothetical protein